MQEKYSSQSAFMIQAMPRAIVPIGKEANTRRSRDGEWAEKGYKSYFGYKAHVKVDTENNIIRKVETVGRSRTAPLQFNCPTHD